VPQVEQKEDVDLYSEWIGNLAGGCMQRFRAQVTGDLLRRGISQEGSFDGRASCFLRLIHGPSGGRLDQAEGQLVRPTCASRIRRKSC